MRLRHLPLLMLVGACGPDFAKQSAINRVRVLAIRADPAELAIPTQPSGRVPPVTLTALAVSPGPQPVSVRYALCRPANPFTPGFDCPGADGFDLDGGVLDLGDPGLRAYFQNHFDGGLAAATGAGGQSGGLSLAVGYLADDGSGTPDGTERGVHVLGVRQTDVPNLNPRFLADGGVTAARDGGPGVLVPLSFSALPLATDVVLTPALAPGSIEAYATPTGPATEHLFYSWYASGDGGIQYLRSQEPVDGVGDRTTHYQTPGAPQQDKLYVVVRDGRGGTDWIIQDLITGP